MVLRKFVVTVAIPEGAETIIAAEIADTLYDNDGNCGRAYEVCDMADLPLYDKEGK